jgi:hypothetical protein
MGVPEADDFSEYQNKCHYGEILPALVLNAPYPSHNHF